MPARPGAATVAAAAILLTVAGVVLTLQLPGALGISHVAGDSPPRHRARDPRPPARSQHRPPPGSPPPGSAAPPRHRNPFGPAAIALADGRPGLVQAAVYDVRTDQQWELGHGRPQAEASVVKLDILETLLARYRAADATLPAADLPIAQQMIEYSDNTAATHLWYAAGGPRQIGSYNAVVGLRGTAMSQCVVCAGFPWPGWGLTTTTPADQVALLRRLISPGPLLTRSQRRYALRLLEHVTPAQRWGVSGGVPPGITVALKNGWLPLTSTDDDWQVNSVGWISGNGRSYLIAVLTTGNPTEQDGIDIIGQLSAIVWRNM
jgi:Beta-lactamase enzyme family